MIWIKGRDGLTRLAEFSGRIWDEQISRAIKNNDGQGAKTEHGCTLTIHMDFLCKTGDCRAVLISDSQLLNFSGRRGLTSVKSSSSDESQLAAARDGQLNLQRPRMVDLVVAQMRVPNKKLLLEELARLSAPLANLDRSSVLAALKERERIGCTGIGQGAALPHARFAELQRPVTVFARLSAPIEYEAIDEKRVDLIYLLLGPEIASDEHLKALACAARLLRDPTVRQDLRHAANEEAISAILAGKA
jgi:PTS system nitrogen regulatory IIA component